MDDLNYITALQDDAFVLGRKVERLEAENARLREALETMVEMIEMNGFGRDYAMDLARAALKGGKDET